LPRGAAGEPPIDESIVDPDDVLAAAQGALDAGRPFSAHEYLETGWHRSPDAERNLWQGLAQLAVGLTHLQRRNATGAASLLGRAAENLSSYAGTTPHGVDVDGVTKSIADLLGQLPHDVPGDLPVLRLLVVDTDNA
jgi:predicted metal-dependent hydrolase